MTFMNYECEPVALNLEQTINVRAGVANACVEEPSQFVGSNFSWVTNIQCTGTTS